VGGFTLLSVIISSYRKLEFSTNKEKGLFPPSQSLNSSHLSLSLSLKVTYLGNDLKYFSFQSKKNEIKIVIDDYAWIHNMFDSCLRIKMDSSSCERLAF
jgi:hypothetical protein